MTGANITAVRPVEVAMQVERLRKRGRNKFVLRAVAHGGMLDRERLGAARYAAGLQAEVTLDVTEPALIASLARRR